MKINDLTSPQHFNNPKMIPVGLVVHSTANRAKSADDLAHDRYYDNNSDRVSVHWTVDADSATLSVLEDRVAWHAGNKQYNLNWLGMEICENNVINNKLDLATYENAVKLAADILHRHGWGINQMIQHREVPGREWKNCPNKDLIHWPTFQADVLKELYKKVTPKKDEPKMEQQIPQWKIDALKQMEELGIYTKGAHKPEEPVDKGFLAAVITNVLKGL